VRVCQFPPLRLKLSDNDCNANYKFAILGLTPERLSFVPVGEAACLRGSGRRYRRPWLRRGMQPALV